MDPREQWNKQSEIVESLERFIDVVRPLRPGSGAPESAEYWYRGQTNTDWGLETSFLRMTRHLAEDARTTTVERLHTALRDPAASPIVLPLEFKFFSSARMAEQQRRFTLCFRPDQDHTCIAAKIAPTHLKKIIIPHEAKPNFLAELRRMNITAAALFPGVDGLGRSIAELTSLGVVHAAAARLA